MVISKEQTWDQKYAIPGMLFFGTVSIVLNKLAYDQVSTGKTEYGNPRKFYKPWILTDTMFIGMIFALIVYFYTKKEDKKVQENEGEKYDWTLYFKILIPTVLDLVESSLLDISLLFIQASAWQMIRGSSVLFTQILAITYLKRKHFLYQWVSVGIIVISLGLVGYSSVLINGFGRAGVSSTKVIISIVLVLSSQCLGAFRIVIEDEVLHDMTASPYLVVGVKGIWGTFIVTFILMPILQFTSFLGNEGEGLHEDTIDTFIMLKNNMNIILLLIIIIFLVGAFNIFAMIITDQLNAVVSTILQGFRALSIWIVQLAIYYIFSSGNTVVGEKLTPYSYLQLIGFLILFYGSLTYKKILPLPFIEYPTEE